MAKQTDVLQVAWAAAGGYYVPWKGQPPSPDAGGLGLGSVPNTSR